MTYREQVNSATGARVFASPQRFSGERPPIPNGTIVKVSCKLYAPSAPSLGQGYWYRLASAPWNNEFYTPANSFLNGDKPGSLGTHDTDWRVPDCPSP